MRLAFAPVLALACLFTFDARGDELEKVSMRLQWLHQAQFAGFYVAAQEGHYAREGLDVSLEPGGLDFPAIQMVAGGSETFGLAPADRVLLAREKGVPVVALAVIFQESPMIYFAAERSGISSPSDFAGKIAGVKLGGMEELLWRALLERTGVEASSLTEVPVKYDMTPFLTGRVDIWPGYSINEPNLALEKGVPVRVFRPAEHGIRLYGDTLIATEETVEKRPELVARFVRATLAGWEQALAEPNTGVDDTLRYDAKLSRAHQEAMLEAAAPLVWPERVALGWMEAARWQETQALLLAQGFMKRPVDVKALFTTRFLPGSHAE